MKRLPHANELACILNNNESSDDSYQNSSDFFSKNIILILNALRFHLPDSLLPELTLCDCCWECVSAWTKDDSRRVTKLRVYFLERNHYSFLICRKQLIF